MNISIKRHIYMKKVMIGILLIIIFIAITGCNKNQVVIKIMKGKNNQNYNIYNNTSKIINEINNVDVDDDGINDDVILYYKDGVRLKVKDADVLVVDTEDEERIFGTVLSDKYYFNLYACENKILVIRNHFINKYGNKVELNCYDYTSKGLTEIWSSINELDKSIIIDSYNEKNNCINVSINKEKKKIILNNEDEESYLKFINFLKKNGHSNFKMEFMVITDYVIEKLESWFGSAEPEKAEEIEFP